MFFRRKPKIKRPLTRRIINYFIGTGVALIVILLVAFGYSQTSSFRNWLRDFLVEQVNSSTNGKLTIKELDGTVLTSLILSQTVYTLGEDTIFSAEKIELKVSPLRIFLKTFYFRKLEIENASVSLLKDENGELNISKITSPSGEKEVEDTVATSEPFSWKIDIADLKLKNFNFRHQTVANKNSTANYPQPEMDDLRLENLNLSLSGVANIAVNEYELYISELSVKPNLIGFNLIDLSGNLVLLNDKAGVKDLRIVTDRSDISINAAISDFSPFGDKEFNLQNSPLKLDLDAANFNFDDLTNFISGTDLIKGDVETHVNAAGTLTDLELKALKIQFNETRLEASGFLQNILGGADMLINTKFRNSYVNQDDVNNLLHTIDIPVYKDLGILQFDTLYFEGKPLNFDAGLSLQTKRGKILAEVKMDLSGEEIIYDYRIRTNNLDLESIAGIKTKLNLYGSLKGKGFSPENLETSIQLNALQSTIEKTSFNDITINANGADGIIKTEVSFSSQTTNGDVSTSFNFTDTVNTKYNFGIVLSGFNIKDFVQESELSSDLNIKLTGDGENFDQDRLNLFAVLRIDSSRLNEITIDSTTLIADIRSSEENRVINIISDLADLTVTGKFTLMEVIDVFSEKVRVLSSTIKKRIDRIQPPKFTSSQPDEFYSNTKEDNPLAITSRSLNVNYLIELKSFELLSLFLGNSEIEVDGELSGKIITSNDSISVILNTKIEQMKYWDGTDLFYLSDFNLSLTMNDLISVSSFDDFLADLNVKAKRIIIGSEITDLNLDLNFLQNHAQLDLKALYEEFALLDLTGSFVVNDDYVDVLFNDLLIKYREFDLRNSGDVTFSYSNDQFIFNTFTLVHNGGKLDLSGKFSLTGDEDLILKLSGFRTKDLYANLLDLPTDRAFGGELNLDFIMSGTADSPVIKLSYNIDSVRVQSLYLGSIASTIEYSNKLLDIDLRFLETKNFQSRRWLGFSGNIPIDLSFYSQERFIKGETIDLTFFADKFDLRFLTGLVPGVTNLKGFLNGDVKFSGSYEDLQSKGEFSIGNTSFILKVNNLTYLLDANFIFDNDKIILSNLRLRNEPNIKDGGVITAGGEIIHQNFKIDKIDISAAGDLKLLDDRSKAVNPSFYGDVAIKTRKDITFLSTDERSYLSADLILKNGASITYSPAQSAFSNENDKFIYIFESAEDGDMRKKQIDSLIQISQKKKEDLAKKIPFDLDLKIEVENEAKMVFVLSREFKQNLTAYLGGNFEYSVINNVPVARGELTLLDGSKLDFIKTFQAEGNIKFLDELDNPYVNVTANYESYYSPDTLRTGANEYDVQVRIKLEGPAKTLTTNFLQDESNIEVYKKRRNYNQYELDPSKTSSDAMFFIIVNKFPEDATLQESNLAVSTAASLAGSIVGNVLNEKLGDVVRSVNVQQVGTDTKISLIGKVEEFRYEIGGTSQVFQDLSRANVKIERSVIFPNLIVRFDRREPSYQSATFSEMIIELGLKYSFIF
ncbi:MAG: hypothetical protein WBQ32_09220 [Ignavibacteriaceae bacterium]